MIGASEVWKVKSVSQEEAAEPGIGAQPPGGDVHGSEAQLAQMASETPLSNRGSVTPLEDKEDRKGEVEGPPLNFHLDYLTLTVFESGEEVSGLLSALLESRNIPAVPTEEKSVGRWAERVSFEGTGICLRKMADGNWVSVELTGTGCSALGSDAISRLCLSLTQANVRWHVTRVDITWDYCGFRPAQILEAAQSGNIKSRLQGAKCGGWHYGPEGRTAEVGNRKSPFFLRCYDKRGYTRLEAELKDDWAKAFGSEVLGKLPPDQWEQQALSYLLRGADFVDSSASSRIDRCPRLPWWQDFTGDAEKLSKLPLAKRSRVPSVFGEEQDVWVDAHLANQRVRKTVAALVEAFGWSWVVSQVDRVKSLPEVQEKARRFQRVAGRAAAQLSSFGDFSIESRLRAESALPI